MSDFKSTISSYIIQLLKDNKLTQRELAAMLGINVASISGYIKGRDVPKIETLVKLAKIGELTVDELLKSKPAKKSDIIFEVRGNNNITPISNGGNIHIGDTHNNTTFKKTYKYSYEEGDLTEEQCARLHSLVDDIVMMENITRKVPKSYAAVWNALKKYMKVAFYRKIPSVGGFEKAELYLQKWRGRLKQKTSFSRNDPDEYRKKRYGDIFAIAMKELGWKKEDVDLYILDNYGVPSIRDLDKDQLENLYHKMHYRKSKKKIP